MINTPFEHTNIESSPKFLKPEDVGEFVTITKAELFTSMASMNIGTPSKIEPSKIDNDKPLYENTSYTKMFKDVKDEITLPEFKPLTGFDYLK